jgi:YfiH family protein
VALLRSNALGASGFPHAFPERSAADEDLARELGLPPGLGVVQVKQVHGAEAIDAAEAGPDRCADALVGRAGVSPTAVGVRVADCVPVLVADEASGNVAAIHAGWRGVVAGVVHAGVARLAATGTRGATPRLVAAIGPCIGPCCFEVGREVAEQIANALKGVNVIVAERGDKAFVDLRVAVRAQLLAAGVEGPRIDDVAGCTKHEIARFHSFRRDGPGSGRMLAAIAARRQA